MILKFSQYLRKGLWRRDESGSTAVEFGLLAGPFFFLIVGLLETTLYFAAGSILEGATHHASRVIRTGQAQQSGDALQAFIDRICEYDSALVDCNSIDFEVIPVADNTFQGAENMDPVIDGDGNFVSQGFDPGGVSDVVLIRLVFQYDFKTPMLGHVLAAGNGGESSLLFSTVVIRNEPYEFEDSGT